MNAYFTDIYFADVSLMHLFLFSAVSKSIVSGDLVLEDDFEQEGGTLLGTGKNAVLSKEENSEDEEEEEELKNLKMERMQRSRPISMKNPVYGCPLEVWEMFSERACVIFISPQPSRPIQIQTPPKYKRPMSDFIADERPFGVPPPTRDSSSSDEGPPPDPFQTILSGQDGQRPRSSKGPSDASVENLEYKTSESGIAKETDDAKPEQPRVEQPRMELRSPSKSDSRPIDEQTAVVLVFLCPLSR